jgi:hypothetical protein
MPVLYPLCGHSHYLDQPGKLYALERAVSARLCWQDVTEELRTHVRAFQTRLM